MNKIYFPNLNGLRFIAALMVIIHHVEQIKHILGFEHNWSNAVVFAIGKLGVVLFFVLSGFLITYLLLAEENQTGTIAIKQFYVRRILRIWPLYYLIILLAFVIGPNIHFLRMEDWTKLVYDDIWIKLPLFVFFLPNLALTIFAPVPYASQAWSVGVEEQFYLIWPVLMKKIRAKRLLLLSIIALYLFIRLIAVPFIQHQLLQNSYIDALSGFLSSFSIDSMAIGGLFAVSLHNQDKLLKFLFSKYTQIVTLLLLFFMIGWDFQLLYIHSETYSVLFGVVIINLAGNKNSLLNLEFEPLNYLGKISYGLYMYHPMAIMIGVKLLNFAGTRNWILQYLLCITLTVVMAGLSYKYFEKYFVSMKIKFSKVLSGDNAKTI